MKIPSSLLAAFAAHPEIVQNPPVLFDIGASGGLYPEWEDIAAFSIGVAFDADSREFGYIEGKQSAFKKLFVVNKIVVDTHDVEKDFYLTKSPFCSSLLRPDLESLKEFHYSPLFEVDRVVRLKVMNLVDALQQCGVKHIDWFKSDSQGTDLRLFKSLPESIQQQAILLEMEPGFISAYQGEDKIHHLLQYMDSQPFYLCHFEVKGPIRMPAALFDGFFGAAAGFKRKLAEASVPHVPGWAEMIFMNHLSETPNLRAYLLAWLFAMLKGHPELALVYAFRAKEQFQDPFLDRLHQYAASQLKGQASSVRSLFKIILKKILLKLS